jgi:hypothetical protein
MVEEQNEQHKLLPRMIQEHASARKLFTALSYSHLQKWLRVPYGSLPESF